MTSRANILLVKLQLFPTRGDPDTSSTLGDYGVLKPATAKNAKKVKSALELFFQDLKAPLPTNYEVDGEAGNIYWQLPADTAYLFKDLLVRRGGVPPQRVQVAKEFEAEENAEELSYFENRKNSYLTAIKKVKYEGMTPTQAITEMYQTTPEWQFLPPWEGGGPDEPLEVVMLRLLDPTGDRTIYQAQKDYLTLAPQKKHKKPISITKSKAFDFHFSEEEDEEGEEAEEEDELDEEEEGAEENTEWLETAKRQEPVSYKKKQLPQTKYLPAPIYTAPNFPQPPKGSHLYHLWSYNGSNYVPLTLNGVWIGTDNIEEAKSLASTYGAKVWPRTIGIKNFNLWTVDAETGKVIPVIYQVENSLIHLGQDLQEKAEKMVRILNKENINAIVIPRDQKVYQGQNLNYYVGRRR